MRKLPLSIVFVKAIEITFHYEVEIDYCNFRNYEHSREDRLRLRKVNWSFCLVHSSDTILISF